MDNSIRITEWRETALRRVLTDRGVEQPSYAVVVPLIRETGEMLIEVRAAGISQAGDPCFPGGRIEPGETPAEAAAREMEEELGIRADPAGFLGQLPTVQTYLGSRSAVFVCLISQQDTVEMRINSSEVDQVLRVPIEFFLERPDSGSYHIEGHVVWGMTAGAIRHFCSAWLRTDKKDKNDFEINPD